MQSVLHAHSVYTAMLKSIVATLVLVCALYLQQCSAQQIPENVTCEDGRDTCDVCFNKLVAETLGSGDNQLAMQQAFFPPNTSSPVYIVVYYSYKTINETKTWFWSASTYYALFSPLTIHQFTSLFFGDPAFRSTTLHLTLPDDCYDTSEDLMHLLTQRVIELVKPISVNIFIM